jgi:hypothetical protein
VERTRSTLEFAAGGIATSMVAHGGTSSARRAVLGVGAFDAMMRR